MEIIRIPSGYNEQLKWCSDKDLAYITRSLFSHASGQKIEVEESMRGGILLSMIREATQMENRARAKKGQKSLQIDLATPSRDTVGTPGVHPSNIKEHQVTSSKFRKPTDFEVIEYMKEKNFINPGAECEKFVDHYNANGWKVGKNSMKDWKAAVRNWAKNEKFGVKTRKPLTEMTDEERFNSM